MPKVWCGPYALGRASGLGYGRARDLLRDVAGWKGWGGLATVLLDRAVDELGGCEIPKQRPRPTVLWFAMSFPGRYVVQVRNHYLAVVDGRIADSMYGDQGRRIHPGCLCRVKRAWQIPATEENING